MIVGENGNVIPGVISNGKTLFTGAITNLFSFSTGAFEVLKEFDIEYIFIKNFVVYSKRVTVSKASINFSASAPQGYIGIADLVSLSNRDPINNTCIRVFPKSSTVNVRVAFDSSYAIDGATQLTSNTINIPAADAYYYFRLYV